MNGEVVGEKENVEGIRYKVQGIGDVKEHSFTLVL
jgi:hypothetical protein